MTEMPEMFYSTKLSQKTWKYWKAYLYYQVFFYVISPEGAKHLICQLLVVDRSKRNTATDVLCHKWILNHGQPGLVAPDVAAAAADSAAAETRQMLEEQARLNYVSYQRLKEKKRRRRNKGQE